MSIYAYIGAFSLMQFSTDFPFFCITGLLICRRILIDRYADLLKEEKFIEIQKSRNLQEKGNNIEQNNIII